MSYEGKPGLGELIIAILSIYLLLVPKAQMWTFHMSRGYKMYVRSIKYFAAKN